MFDDVYVLFQLDYYKLIGSALQPMII